MYLIQYNFAHFREGYNLTQLLRSHFVKMVPRELRFFLNLPCDFVKVRHMLELTEGSHRAPEAFFDHFAEVEHYFG